MSDEIGGKYLTVDWMMYWLRNGGQDGSPFVTPAEIKKADPDVTITFGLGGDANSMTDLVMVEADGHQVGAPFNDDGEIVWEDWRVIIESGRPVLPGIREQS